MLQHAKVSVHVIEVRELPGRGSSMLCDPFVRVTVNGTSQQTPIRYQQTSAVFDDYFTFSDLVFTMDEYKRASIRVEVFDAKVFFRNELIGQSLFGLASIRELASHEIHQQWVELEHPQSSGAGNGFLRLSISVVGDSDRPTGHSTTGHFNKTLKEIQMNAPSTAIGQILTNPVLFEKRRGYNFQIKVFRAEHLLSEGNTFVMVRFGGVSCQTPIKPKSKSPDWNFQLTMAVFTPRFSDSVEVELWSSGVLSETLIGSVTLKFSEIMAYYYPPSWFNLYGPAPEEVGGLANWWASNVTKQRMEPTSYLGRCLLAFSATLNEHPQPDQRLCDPSSGPETCQYVVWIDVLKAIELEVPSFGDVMIQVCFGPSENDRQTEWCKAEDEVSYAAAVPAVGGAPGATQKVVKFSCKDVFRMQRAAAAAKKHGGGDEGFFPYAQFARMKVILPKMDPKDGARRTSQLYDLVFNVYVRNATNAVTKVGYVKIRPSDVWGFENDPEWHPIRGLVHQETKFSKSAGFLQLSVKFGPLELEQKFLQHKRKQRVEYGALTQQLFPYEIRAYVYQARNLPTSDEATGLLSCAVEMNLAGVPAKRQYTMWHRGEGGNEHRTTVAEQTLNPIWYDTLILQCMLPQYDASSFKTQYSSTTPSGRKKRKRYLSLALSPDIELTLKSTNAGGGGAADAVVGRIRFPTELATRKFWPKRARPRWIKFIKNDATTGRMDPTQMGDTYTPTGDYYGGDLLVKLEVVPQEYADRKPWYNRHRWPKLQHAKLSIASVGLRNLLSVNSQHPDDDSRVPVDDVGDSLAFLELSVPLFPDMRAIVKSAVAEIDKQKASKQTGQVTLQLGNGGGGSSSARAGGAGGGDDDDVSEAESLDSEEKRELAEYKAYEDEAEYSLGDRDTTAGGGDDQEEEDGEEEDGRYFDQPEEEEEEDDDEEEEGGDVEQGAMRRRRQQQQQLQRQLKRQSERDNAAEGGPDLAELQVNHRKYVEAEIRRSLAEKHSTCGDFAVYRISLSTEEQAAFMDAAAKQQQQQQDVEQQQQQDVEQQQQTGGGSSSSSASSNKLYTELVQERAFTFFKLVQMDINYPDDGFYAPSLTVRLITKPAKGWWFSSQPSKEAVFGSCVIPLRPYASDDRAEKPVDKVFHLPKVALSQSGKDQFEAIARRDSDFTNSTIQTGLDGANGGGDGASETSTIHSLFQREDSQATILKEDEDDANGTGGGHAAMLDEDDGPLAIPAGNVGPVSITTDDDTLNNVFSVEVNSSNFRVGGASSSRNDFTTKREAAAAAVDAGGNAHHRHEDDDDSNNGRGGSSDGGAHGGGEDEEEDDLAKMAAEDAARRAEKQEKKVQRELEEFTSVFWPVGVSNKQIVVVDSVESNLEDDPRVLVPHPFECFLLKRGSKVNQNEVCVGRFKAVLQVMQLTSVLKAEDDDRILYQTDEYDVDEAKTLREFASNNNEEDGVVPSSSSGAIATYLNGGFYRFEEELQLAKQQQNIFPIHDLLSRGPQLMKARVYIVQANLLWSSNPVACKPFVKLQMAAPTRSLETLEGLTYAIDDSFNRKEGTSPFIGTMYELDFRLPDVTQLEIRVYDSAPLLGSELIGTTKIDLEDRWFNPKWQVMKKKKAFYREFRTLTIPSSVIPRGSLEMWVEMYEPFESVDTKVIDIRRPKSDEWELRLVVWETRNVPPPDEQNYISMYVTTELSYRGNDGNWKPHQYQSTDTHWWVSDGTGSFNWRKKFSLEVPCRFPRLTFKVWQTELVSVIPDEVVGQATVDIDFLAAICNAWEGDEPYERPRMMVRLTQDRGTAPRGELDVQISMVRRKVADADPVGLAREPPNKDPFLPPPKRQSFWAMFFGGGGWYYRVFCLLLVLAIIGAVVAVCVVML